MEMLFPIFEILSSALGYVGYIRSNSFLQPLDKEEEAHCIAGLSLQDEECRNKLIEHNLRYQKRTNRRFNKHWNYRFNQSN